MKQYDYLIVGAGLFAATFAHQAKQKGKRCLVIDKRPHIGGNVYCENIQGINVHQYGAHIFHTDNEEIWRYVNSFVTFNRYTHAPVANYQGEIYNLPFNMNTFNKLWGVITPQQARDKIEQQKLIAGINDPENLQQQAIFLVGMDIYNKLIKGYTEKQWGRSATQLPPFIIKRLPVRFTYDNNYFNEQYQGIPQGGYNVIIEKMLQGVDIKLSTDFFPNRSDLTKISRKIVFTGMIDEFYNYRFGILEYRSLKFEHQLLDCRNHQGVSVINYTEKKIPYTRVIEHKHFEYGDQDQTVITREYPTEWKKGDEPYYPINDNKNNKLFNNYKKLAEKEQNIIFGGRLGNYKYYDMHQVIEAALEVSKKELFK